jgi:hypothetical protein
LKHRKYYFLLKEYSGDSQVQHPKMAEQQEKKQPSENGKMPEEIPGSRDPDSILKPDVIGNFEQVPVVFPPENPNAEG